MRFPAGLKLKNRFLLFYGVALAREYDDCQTYV